MIDGTIFLAILVLSAGLLILAVVDSLTVGTGIIKGLWGLIRNRLTSSFEIETPPDLAVAAANGLLHSGSQLVVGTEAEWEGLQVSTFSVSPQAVSMPAGTRLEVIQISQQNLRLRPLARNPER